MIHILILHVWKYFLTNLKGYSRIKCYKHNSIYIWFLSDSQDQPDPGHELDPRQFVRLQHRQYHLIPPSRTRWTWSLRFNGQESWGIPPREDLRKYVRNIHSHHGTGNYPSHYSLTEIPPGFYQLPDILIQFHANRPSPAHQRSQEKLQIDWSRETFIVRRSNIQWRRINGDFRWQL